MLRLVGGQVESLWDEVLPIEVRELPDDLAGAGRAAFGSGVVGADRGELAGSRRGRMVDRRSRWRRMCG